MIPADIQKKNQKPSFSKRLGFYVITLLLSIFLCPITFSTQQSENYQLRCTYFAGGGGRAASENHIMKNSAFGTSIEGRELGSEHYQINGLIVSFASLFENFVTVRIPDISGYKGQNIIVTVEVDKADYITAIDFTLTYDDSLLAPDVAQTTGLTQDWHIDSYTTQAGMLKVSLAHSEMLADKGTIVHIPFTVSADAQIGATSPLTLTYVSINEGKIMSKNISGTFTVESSIKGDVSGNGEITAFDASLILQFVIGLVSAEDYPNLTVEIADVTGDETISALDAAMILQYAVGLIAEFPAERKPLAPALNAKEENELVARAIRELEGMNLSLEQKEVLLQLKRLVTSQTIPSRSALYQNYPNPFNPETWIPYQLAESGDVKIAIYNSQGQLIRILNIGKKNAGVYFTKDSSAYWDGRDDKGQPVASGVYFYTLHSGSFKTTRKMVIMK